jgi:hypothetical protein
VDGWHISWQHWDFHIGFNGREGLVLHDLGYRDSDQGGRRRPILHRASIVEMCVPVSGWVGGEGHWEGGGVGGGQSPDQGNQLLLRLCC